MTAAHGMSPLREYELVRQQAATCPLRPQSAKRCHICKRDLRRARLRLGLSIAAYTAVAVFAVAAVWALVVLVWAAGSPVSDYQLPTK